MAFPDDIYEVPGPTLSMLAMMKAQRQKSHNLSAIMAQQQAQSVGLGVGMPFGSNHPLRGSPPDEHPERTLVLIKKSIRQIKAEAVSEEAQMRVRSKIDRLKDLGVQAQARILEVELQVRMKLMRVQEWDYKVLPAEELGRFADEHRMTATRDGLRVHIDPLEAYCGAPGEAKDRIIPNAVLDKLEEAKDRQVFDEFKVLSVEQVKDPLLLGSISGCKDYFLIAEWGEDVSFDQIMKKES